MLTIPLFPPLSFPDISGEHRWRSFVTHIPPFTNVPSCLPVTAAQAELQPDAFWSALYWILFFFVFLGEKRWRNIFFFLMVCWVAPHPQCWIMGCWICQLNLLPASDDPHNISGHLKKPGWSPSFPRWSAHVNIWLREETRTLSTGVRKVFLFTYFSHMNFTS